MIPLDRPPTGVPSLPTTVPETLAEYLDVYDLRYRRPPVDAFWEPNGAGTGAWCNGPAQTLFLVQLGPWSRLRLRRRPLWLLACAGVQDPAGDHFAE